jgi:uncharacterized protein
MHLMDGSFSMWHRCVLALSLCVPLFVSPVVWARECPPAPLMPTPQVMSKAAQGAVDRGLLWKISKAGRVSYLYGTMHVGKPEWFAMGPRLAQAFSSSRVLALEVNVLDPAVVQAMQAGAKPLARDAQLPSDLKARLRLAAERVCMDRAQQDALGTEMLLMQIMLTDVRHLGFDASMGSEILLAVTSMGLGKRVQGLELVDEQLAAIRAQSMEELSDYLRTSLDMIEGGKLRPMMQRLAKAWAEGDVQTLETYEQWCDCVATQADRDMLKRLLDDRNVKMAERIDRLHGAGGVFAAVGALHMVGPKALPELMRQLGYQVERVF